MIASYQPLAGVKVLDLGILIHPRSRRPSWSRWAPTW